MTLMRNRAGSASVIVVVLLLVGGQSAPNLSGDWVLATATASGGRSTGAGAAPQPAEERPTTSHTTSGAAFNCGRECRIVHKAQTLTVENALLASATSPAPAVTLQLNGQETSVVNSFGPGGQIPTTATWNGAKLEIASKMGPMGITQVLSMEGTQLVVVTSGDRGPRTTLKYKKK